MSNDMFLGCPFNLINYTLLLYMVAHLVDRKPSKLHYVIGDAHIYKDHLPLVRTQLQRSSYSPPVLKINRKVESIDDFKFTDFDLIDYRSAEPLRGKVSI